MTISIVFLRPLPEYDTYVPVDDEVNCPEMIDQLRETGNFGLWKPFRVHEFEMHVRRNRAATPIPDVAKLWGAGTGFVMSAAALSLIGEDGAPGATVLPLLDDQAAFLLVEEIVGVCDEERTSRQNIVTRDPFRIDKLVVLQFVPEMVPLGRLFTFRTTTQLRWGVYASSDGTGRFPRVVELLRSGELTGHEVVEVWRSPDQSFPHMAYS
jgi:hypothetical protein